MQLSEIRTRVLERLDEDLTTPLRWTESDVDGFINEGHQYIAVRTGSVINTAPIVARAYDFHYELPRDCVQVLRVFRDSPLEKVWPVNWREIDIQQPGWREITGTRWEWYMVFGLDEIILGPAFTTGGEAYTLTYAQDPGEGFLVADADEPLIPRRFHESLVDYGIARALMVDADPEKLTEISEHLKMFLAQVARLKREQQANLNRLRQMRDEDPDGVEFGILTGQYR